MDVASTGIAAAVRPGKSAQAVGQMAKVSVAEARLAGIDLPKNAQGMAASAIAQGTDPRSVFAAIVTSDPIEDSIDQGAEFGLNGEEETNIGAIDEPNSELKPVEAATIAAIAGYATSADVINVSESSGGAEVALALLDEAA